MKAVNLVYCSENLISNRTQNVLFDLINDGITVKEIKKYEKSEDFSKNFTVFLVCEKDYKTFSENIKNENSFVLPLGKNYHEFYPKLIEKLKSENATIKLFGVNELDLKDFLNESKENYEITSIDGDIKLVLDKPLYALNEKFIKDLMVNFGEFIYAETDVSLKEQFLTILKMRNLKTSVAESFTGGNLSAEITSVSGASSVFFEGAVTYNELAKQMRLGVAEESIEKYNPVSDKVAYEMVKGLLKTGVDFAISTTGIAGPNSDSSGYKVGLCYFGVGSKRKISVYKYEFNGSRKEIVQKGVKTALFLAVKALRDGSYDV